MELSEKERLMLVRKKEEINELSKEIIENLNTKPEVVLLKRNINSILSLIGIIGSYSDSKNYNLQFLAQTASMIFVSIDMANLRNNWLEVIALLEYWCNIVNSIQFKLTKRKLEIKIPRIDISIFKQDKSVL